MLTPNTTVAVVDREGQSRNGKVLQVMGYLGLERVEADRAEAGDIVCVTGIDALNISDTLCDPAAPEALPALTVDEPTVSMTFQVNDSPFAGREGKYVTSRNIKERLERELIHNVALRVEQGDSPDKFKVSGRGELHLSVLIENMRREGFELGVSRPEVIQKEIDGKLCEPYEQLVIDCEEAHQGGVMEELGLRRAELQNLVTDGAGRVRLEFIVPARGLIGFRSQFLTLTSGSGIMTHVFDHYGPVAKSELGAHTVVARTQLRLGHRPVVIEHVGHDPRARGQGQKLRSETDQAAGGHNKFETYPTSTVGDEILELRPAQPQLFHHATLMRFLAVNDKLLIGFVQFAIDLFLDDLGSRYTELKTLAAHIFNQHREV